MNIRNQRRFKEALKALGAFTDVEDDGVTVAFDAMIVAFFPPPGCYKSWRAWCSRGTGREAPGNVAEWLWCNYDHGQRSDIEDDFDAVVAGCESRPALMNLITAIQQIADSLSDWEFNTWASIPTARLMRLELNIPQLQFVCEHGMDADDESFVASAICQLLCRGHYPGKLAVTDSLFLMEMGERTDLLACNWEHIFESCDAQMRAEILERVQRALRHYPRSPTLRAMRDELEDI